MLEGERGGRGRGEEGGEGREGERGGRGRGLTNN